MLKTLLTIFVATALGLLSACSTRPALYQPSDTRLAPGNPEDFDGYLANTRRYLEENLVALPGFSRRDQVDWNMPFRSMPPEKCRTGPTQPTRGILLVHGLSDSPFVFRDFARVLAKDCVQVRTVLLQGHGTRPGDMTRAEADVWREQVRNHFNALARDVDIPMIGGFSLGGALATELALSSADPKPAGLVAIAPAWELNGLKNYLWLASTANLFVDFVEQEPELNPVKYESFSINAAVQLADVLDNLRHRFEQAPAFDMPLFLVATEADSVINLPYLIDSFNTRFRNPDNQMLVFRDQRRSWPYAPNPQIMLFDSYRPDLNILEFSHQSLPASPDNELYGLGQPLQRCLEPNLMSLKACRALAKDELWFSAWTDQKQPVPTSRLTYNPEFDRVAKQLSGFIRERDIP
ncbi:alpha/beta hydrolase [Marinobacter confluentis]|uniref:Alpha/beta fold hydrolase n=1 Tax=Marinobacter confluentis TaxID=1697557 RepID=A0A4Z1C1Q7_9GAMM|nr:alpha/beta fold hydrolase [Marinobacter confluentis]TGN38932.1 alpha/beta fold hydrolase [Marinobacter confluentis]